MRKTDFCLCENKDVDQLRSSCEADQHLCISLTGWYNPSSSVQSLFFLISKFQASETIQSDLIGNPEDRFSCVTAHMTLKYSRTVGRQSEPVEF